MKKLILLLLPLFSFSQTFEELMTINSEDTFKRVAIENDYELDSEREGDIYYGWNLDGSKSQMEAIYFKEENKVLFRFHKEEVLGHKTQFKEITKNIKSKCQYDRIDGEAAFYKCPEYLLLPTMMEDERITKDGYQYKYIEGLGYYSRPADAGDDVGWTKLTNESGKEIGFYTSDGSGFVIVIL